jgi:hypothetical protein
MWSFGEKAWSGKTRSGEDLEELVANWLQQQEPADWLPSALVLSTLLAAMVLFAVSRLG